MNTLQVLEVLTDILRCLVYKILLSMFCCQDKKSLLSYVVTWNQGRRFQETKRVQVQNRGHKSESPSAEGWG